MLLSIGNKGGMYNMNLVAIFFIIFCLFMIYYTSSQKTKFRKEIQKKQQEKTASEKTS